jgi:xylulokinase
VVDNGVLSGSRFLVGSVTTSGAVAAWVGRVTGVPVEVLMTEAASVPPGSRGLIVLPYFAGERTPFSNPNARGAIVGLTTSHTPADLYRAALEGAAYAARQNLALSSSKEIAQRRVVAVGGGTAGGRRALGADRLRCHRTTARSPS